MMCSKIRNNVYLLGNECSQITGGKLPSIKQALLVFFYNLRIVKLNVRESARLTIREIIIFWEKARIPVQEIQHCISKLEKLYNEWRTVQKNSTKRTECQIKKEVVFTSKSNDLFDIAHANALNMISIQEDRDFLLLQREKGRKGYMIGVDTKLFQAEKRKANRFNSLLEASKRSKLETEKLDNKIELVSFSSEEEEYDVDYTSESGSEISIPSTYLLNDMSTTTSVVKRGKIDFINDRLVMVLDRCKVSDRDAVHILMATAEALGHDTSNLIINRTSIRQRRLKIRKNIAVKLKSDFKTNSKAIVVHWDGKLLPTSKYIQHDRLPVIVTFQNSEQLIGVPKLDSGTGQNMANAVYELLNDWDLSKRVNALCCDTTASNTGRINGACIILEQLLNKSLLYLPCRHHIYELILRSIFELKMTNFSGPDITLFKRFQLSWEKIDNTKLTIGIANNDIKLKTMDVSNDIIEFCRRQLKENHYRDDYKELIELILIFLGGCPSDEITIKTPGAIHHARWMAKALYSIKIYLFRDQFHLSIKEENGLRDICIFLIRIYVKAWFGAPHAATAPYQDFNFIKDVYNYYDTTVSKTVLKKFCGHLWYLSDEAIGFSFFDNNVSADLKKRMVKALTSNGGSEEIMKKLSIKPHEMSSLVTKDLSDFVTNNTKIFFERFGIDTQFLQDEPEEWTKNPAYNEGANIVAQIKVVNDTAERGVKLIEEYNSILTKEEEQKQYLLQIVKDYKIKYPDSNKSTLQ